MVAVIRRGLLLLVATFSLAAPGGAQPQVPDGFVDEPVASGLHMSACMTFLPDGRVLYTSQLHSRINLVVPGPPAVVSEVGTLDSVRVSPEQGLFGLAVDPRWPDFPYLYVHFAYSGAPRIHISRFRVAGDLDGSLGGTLSLVPGSRRDLLVSLPDSTIIHNGGQLHFGPDSLLYLSVGDDGRNCGAQALTRLIGKILRLEVRHVPDGPGPPPALADITPAGNPFVLHPDPHARLVWALGLRNPYSFAVDRTTGRLAIADVGAGGQEELNVASAPGLNFGWPLYEGFVPRVSCQVADTTAGGTVPPAAVYVRTFTDAAIVCGGVYRPAPGGDSSFPPEYEGNIFFNDVYHGFLRRLIPDGAGWRLADPVPGQPNATDWGTDYDGVTSYQLGPDGALWYSKYAEAYQWFTGEIRRIRWTGPPAAVPGGRPPTRLAAPLPSPAHTLVRIEWTLERDGPAGLNVYDARGALVRRLVPDLPHAAGPHRLSWNLRGDSGRPLPPGLYFVALTTERGRELRRLAIVR